MKREPVGRAAGKRKRDVEDTHTVGADDVGVGTKTSADFDESTLADMLAGRAHVAADTLHQVITEQIDHAHSTLQTLRVNAVLRRTKPLLRGTVRFLREQPLRGVAAFALLGLAAVLSKPAFASR